MNTEKLTRANELQDQIKTKKKLYTQVREATMIKMGVPYSNSHNSDLVSDSTVVIKFEKAPNTSAEHYAICFFRDQLAQILISQIVELENEFNEL